MQPRDSYETFRTFLKQRGQELSVLDVSAALSCMLDFYTLTPAAGVLGPMGDGFVVMWGPLDGSQYAFSLFRTFASNADAPAIGGSRLRLSIQFALSDTMVWFKAAGIELPFMTQYAYDHDRAVLLAAQVRVHPVYKALASQQPSSSTLRHERVWDVF